MKRSVIFISAGLALVAAACGGGDGKSSATTLLGEGIPLDPTTTTSPVASTAPVTTVAAKCPYTDATSEIDYDRLRLTLSVSKLCPAKADDITLTLKVTNIGNAALPYDKNQAHFFSLLAHPTGSGRTRWEDTHCDPPARDRHQPAGTLAPGESITISRLYPAPKTVSDREKCRRLQPGDYAANAEFVACEGDAYVDGYCDVSKASQYKAHPVLIDVR